jgi:2-polyprenyl-6-methoxyphenol hydroxylase-like FAD-dependent oxidoreductase
MAKSDVLIVGAGPSGLVMALWLNKLGVSVRLIDKATEPGTTSRALAVQARTLELYRQLNLTDAVLAEGYRTDAINLWAEGQHRARVSFGAMGAGLTPYPFLYIYPQDRHERLLIARLEAQGVRVERPAELVDYEDRGDCDYVVAHIRKADGSRETCEASFVVGCDGAHSTVRKVMGTGFPGGRYPQVFYVADIEGVGPALNGELNVDLEESDILAVFPMAREGRARMVGTIRDERAERDATLRFDDVSYRVINNLKIEVRKLNWFSTYRVHHRVAEHFRGGRAFLVGDAGHIHSPAGGQGMNTGIGDAINLAWKLAAVVHGRAPDGLLDSYETERIGFARRLVATTDRAFRFITADGPVADIVRTRVAPTVLPLMFKVPAGRRLLFRTVSQTMLNYREGPLSRGIAGHVHGGDRLPWVKADGGDNYAQLDSVDWQVHVYGHAPAELAHWCAAHAVRLQVFEWSKAHEAAGLAPDGLYVLRPDTYVALAGDSATGEALDDYFNDIEVRV